jgi:hypothetical protein
MKRIYAIAIIAIITLTASTQMSARKWYGATFQTGGVVGVTPMNNNYYGFDIVLHWHINNTISVGVGAGMENTNMLVDYSAVYLNGKPQEIVKSREKNTVYVPVFFDMQINFKKKMANLFGQYIRADVGYSFQPYCMNKYGSADNKNVTGGVYTTFAYGIDWIIPNTYGIKLFAQIGPDFQICQFEYDRTYLTGTAEQFTADRKITTEKWMLPGLALKIGIKF